MKEQTVAKNTGNGDSAHVPDDDREQEGQELETPYPHPNGHKKKEQ